jgi:hypothetical protein
MRIPPFFRWPVKWLPCAKSCALLQNTFLIVVAIGLVGQILYDQHPITIVSLFPQWLLLGSLGYLWRQGAISRDNPARSTLVFAVLIPALCCLTLLLAWLGWKANPLAICGVIPISDAASYYISAQTFLREAFLDPSGQRRPLNILLTSLWLYLSGDDFKLLLLLQVLGFSAAAFLASAVVAALHGFRAGLLLFAFLLVFAEPYLPTTLSETNGSIFGILALVAFLFGLYRRSLFCYCFGALLLATGLAIRPSALFVLPCVVVAGSFIFRSIRTRDLVAVVCLTVAILLPSGISILLNRTMSHGEGALNANLSYTIYGLVSGGKGWEQYEKDNPRKLEGLSEADRSRIILEASKQHLKMHPIDLAQGLIKGQMLGPLQTFSQIARLAFLGAGGDPLKLIPPSAIIVISLWFAGVLGCRWIAKRRAGSTNRDFRLFFALVLVGYLVSIPFFYKDGGLRLHAAILPIISYMLVWVLLPCGAAGDNALSNSDANRLLAGTTVIGFVLMGSMGWISLMHPKSHNFDPLSASRSLAEDEIEFRFKPHWPQCDLRKFERVPSGSRPRWLSGAIPDDDYRSRGIREIAGQGNLYFGYDASTREWRIIHAYEPVGLLNKIKLKSGSYDRYRDNRYRDFYSAETVQTIGAK